MNPPPASRARCAARIAARLPTVILILLAVATAGFLAGSTAAAANPPAPALLEALRALPPGGQPQLPIFVTMREQADLAALDAEAVARRLDRRARAALVIPALRARAAAGQRLLRDDLRAWEAAQAVSDVRSFWMVSGFALRANAAVVEALLAREDVAEVALDGTLVLDDPVSGPLAGSVPGQAENGLRVVNAPALWSKGLTGAGVLVMSIDTGVDGGHPALASRWLGHEAGVDDADAWFDPVRGDCDTPCDYESHGTHTMGIMTGLETATADTVGVAFGAHWIAAATIDVGANPHTSFSLAAFQWALEPGGGTRGPADIVSCSWRDPALNHQGDCGPNGIYWSVIDAFETAGGAVVFSAGNNGPAAQSITRPKNRITSPVNVFTTGNIVGNVIGFPIAASSSRGPSTCDGVTIKPEVVAPGNNVRSAVPGGYAFKSGTSMATPHVAGVIALLMEAFPAATGAEIKLALLATAVDLGPAGEDNTYGHGLIDAGAAYLFLAGTADVAAQPAAGAALGVTLGEAAPNPFHPGTAIPYELAQESVVTLKVYNHRGQLVASVMDEVRVGAGHRTAAWDGRTAAGEPAASGMYFFRLSARPAADPEAIPVVLHRQAIRLR